MGSTVNFSIECVLKTTSSWQTAVAVYYILHSSENVGRREGKRAEKVEMKDQKLKMNGNKKKLCSRFTCYRCSGRYLSRSGRWWWTKWSRLAVVVWEIRQRRPLSLLALTSQLLDHQLFCSVFRAALLASAWHPDTTPTASRPSPARSTLSECQWTHFRRRLFVPLSESMNKTSTTIDFKRSWTNRRFMVLISII